MNTIRQLWKRFDETDGATVGFYLWIILFVLGLIFGSPTHTIG